MNRRDILKATGATMLASQLPAQAATGGWDKAKLDQAAAVMADWIKDGRVEGASILVTQGSRQFAKNFGTAKGTEPVFLLASISKPITAAAIKRARGVLKRKPGEKPFRQWWAEYKKEEKEIGRAHV